MLYSHRSNLWHEYWHGWLSECYPRGSGKPIYGTGLLILISSVIHCQWSYHPIPAGGMPLKIQQQSTGQNGIYATFRVSVSTTRLGSAAGYQLAGFVQVSRSSSDLGSWRGRGLREGIASTRGRLFFSILFHDENFPRNLMRLFLMLVDHTKR